MQDWGIRMRSKLLSAIFMAALIIAPMAGQVSPANAAVVNYTVGPVDFVPGMLTGSFDFDDSMGGSYANVQLTLSGTGSPFDGIYGFASLDSDAFQLKALRSAPSAGPPGPPSPFIGDPALVIDFEGASLLTGPIAVINATAFAGPCALTGGGGGPPNFCGDVMFEVSSPTGGALITSVVPTPAALPLMASVLLLGFGLVRRRARNG